MLKNISWSNYWTALFLITLLYYVIIAVVFYRKSISAILFRSKISPQSDNDITHAPEEQENQVR